MSLRLVLLRSWHSAQRIGAANEASIAGALLEAAGGSTRRALEKLATVEEYLRKAAEDEGGDGERQA